MYKILLVLILYIVPCVIFAQQDTLLLDETAEAFNADQLNAFFSQSEARFEFFQGVNLYNAGNFAQALLAFRNAVLLFTQNDATEQSDNDATTVSMYKFWLAKANYAYGNEDIAEVLWRELITQEFFQSYLRNKLEILQSQKNQASTIQLSRLSRASSINLSDRQLLLPMTLKALDNGILGLTVLKSNVVALINPTGIISRFLSKNIDTFKLPMDIEQLSNGTIIVSEFGSNSLSAFNTEGSYTGSFIQHNDEQNEDAITKNVLIGPQFMTKDVFDNVFISVYGTAEIAKFSPEGMLVQRFGRSVGSFSGLENPTGIVVQGNQLWVASNGDAASSLVEFDISGNYVSTVSFEGRISSDTNIESIQTLNNDTLMLTLTNSLIKFDSKQRKIVERLEDSEFSKLISATIDKNGLLWVADQGRNSLDIFTNISNFYTGLHVNMLSVYTNNYPTVRIVFSVKNASNKSITGLTASSIALTEANSPVLAFNMQENTVKERSTNIVIVTGLLNDASDPVQEKRLKDSVAIISENASAKADNNNVIFSLVQPTESIPYVVIENTVLASKVEEFAEAVDTDSVSNKNIYQALHTALNMLLLKQGNKVIIYVGSMNELHDREIWGNLEKALVINNISLFWVKPNIIQGENETASLSPTTSMTYFTSMVERTKGKSYRYPFILQGAETSIIDDIFTPDVGEYTLEFTSKYRSDNAKQYVPIILTGYFYNSSGQDIGGYILPGYDN